ncbi:hypothetical protein GJV85_00055 [Sulfurimonas aquatica]|uniref:beta-lactamase n=1 Tax=Sulfurimonas aquatica TaxID=2672570 RepID=A0A975AXX9_9BACT|nr:tetratricopeptide repeat protein [Sulfurimonas aquatica]QSZ40574.1 hypothetical protein GJV85_00055 [Sulfurimonas aquatica]
MKLSRLFLSLFVTTLLLCVPLVIEQALELYESNKLHTNKSVLLELENLANAGDNSAAFLLATAYKNGKLGEKDLQKASHWYEKSANNGDKDAMLMLGWLFYKGSDTTVIDITKAKYWFTKASNEGVEEAIEMLELLD